MKEVARQIGLLLKVYAPLYAERADQKDKAAKEAVWAHGNALSLTEALGRGGNVAVKAPSKGEDPEVEFLLVGKNEDVVEGTLEVQRDGVSITLGLVTPALALEIAELFSRHVAPAVRCSKKGCTNHNSYGGHGGSLSRAHERAAKRCYSHPRNRKKKSGEDD